jgi:hypothetical protein
MMKFELTESQQKKLEAWKTDVYHRGVELQKSTLNGEHPFRLEYEMSWELGYPYTGAIGGQFTYQFTPNSIGESVRVIDQVTGDHIDLTEYETW